MFLEQDVSEVCQKSERLKDVCNNDEMASFFRVTVYCILYVIACSVDSK